MSKNLADDDLPTFKFWWRLGLACLAAMTVIVVLGFLVQGSDFALYKFFAPKMEQARRDTFEQSKAYNDGMAQDLQAMAFEYAKATPEQKPALASVVLQRTAAYDLKQLSPELRGFVLDLRAARMKGAQ
jgi:NAD/NADP transhydrogenase alpha subunit